MMPSTVRKCRTLAQPSLSVGMLALGLAVAASAELPGRRWMDTADPPKVRAKKLVAEMTFTEKTNLFHGSCGGYTGNVW